MSQLEADLTSEHQTQVAIIKFLQILMSSVANQVIWFLSNQLEKAISEAQDEMKDMIQAKVAEAEENAKKLLQRDLEQQVGSLRWAVMSHNHVWCGNIVDI